MGRKIRTLIIDDSIVFREALSRGIAQDEMIEVVGTANDPYEAVKKIEELDPDVITLDIEMPKMGGIDFLKKLMPQHPMPVVVVSSLPINVFDALDAGAVDFVRKPNVRTPQDMTLFYADLAAKIRIAHMAKVKKPVVLPHQMINTGSSFRSHHNTVIAIGASTGGTEATLSVIADLPATTPPIVVTQHMPANFTKMYAERLNKICKMEVKEAQNGDRLGQGKIFIAPGELQMQVMKDKTGYWLKCYQGEKVSGHAPSVDVLFDSVADAVGKDAVGIILTGMGSDGAKGLLKMKKLGAFTIGQDRESCVVYGMPMVAFNIGAVERQVPLDKVVSVLIGYLNK